MLEITNSKSNGKLNELPPKKNPPRSALPPVRVGVDYRELSHRRISILRPKTASPLVRTVPVKENPLKFKKSRSLAVSGTGAHLHEDSFVSQKSLHLGGSVFSEKSSYKMRSRLSYICHDIEGSKSRDMDHQGSSVIEIEEIEQHLPFSFAFNNESQIELDPLNNDKTEGNDQTLEGIEYDDNVDDEEEEKGGKEERPASPAANDPSRFFIDLWLKKHQQRPTQEEDQFIQPNDNENSQYPNLNTNNNANPMIRQQPEIDSFHMNLLCRLQNAFRKAKHSKRSTKPQAKQRNTSSSEQDRGRRQIDSLKMIAVAALEVFDALIEEQGKPAAMIYPAIKDALLPLIFDQSELSVEQPVSEDLQGNPNNNNHPSSSSRSLGSTSQSYSSLLLFPSSSSSPLDYNAFSTYLEKYSQTNQYHSDLTAKYEKLLKDYLSVEITRDDYYKQLTKTQNKAQQTSEQLQLLSLKHQELRSQYEAGEGRIRELEALLLKEKERGIGLQEKVTHFESEHHLLKIEQQNVRKERQKFESEWSGLLIENDKLRKENDSAVKVKLECKRQLSELNEKYQSLLEKFREVQRSFHNHYEDELLGKVNDLMNSDWIDFKDDDYEKIKHQSAIIVGDDGEGEAMDLALTQLSSTIASKRSTTTTNPNPLNPLNPPLPSLPASSVGMEERRKSIASINAVLSKSKSMSMILQSIDDNINSESQEIELFAGQLEDDYNIFSDAFRHLSQQIQHSNKVEEQYQSRLKELYDDRQRLLTLHRQQLLDTQLKHREEHKKFNASNQEVQETLRKTIYQKETDIATYIEVRRRHERQIERLNEELVAMETRFDQTLEQRNRYEAIVVMMRSDPFLKRQEERYETAIETMKKKEMKLREEYDDTKKELNLQVKETHRVRENSDRQIYLLMKEKDKLSKEKAEQLTRIDQLIEQGREADRLAFERESLTRSEVESWRAVTSDLKRELEDQPEVKEEETQTNNITEKRDFEQQVSKDLINAEDNSKNKKASNSSRKSVSSNGGNERRKKSQRVGGGNAATNSNKKKLKAKGRLSMHSISEDHEGEDDTQREENIKEEGLVGSDSDLSDSEGEENKDNSDDSSSSEEEDNNEVDNDNDDEAEAEARQRRREKKQKKKEAKKQKRLDKLKNQLTKRRASTIILDPRLFTEERKKTILRESIKNSILFDRDYIPVEANSFYDNPEVVKEFVSSLKMKLNLFRDLKQSLEAEKKKIQAELERFQALFFQEKEIILRELQRKIVAMNQMTIAEVLNEELKRVIVTEQRSISSDLIPDDVRHFSEKAVDVLSLVSRTSNDNNFSASQRKISFLLDNDSKDAPSASFMNTRQSLPLPNDPNDPSLNPNPAMMSNVSHEPFRSITRESLLIDPSQGIGAASSSFLFNHNYDTANSHQTTIQSKPMQSKSEDQLDKVIDIKALIKLSKKLGNFVFKKRQKSLGISRHNSVASAMDSSMQLDSSDDDDDEEGLGGNIDDETMQVDGFESIDTLQEMKKQKKKRKTMKAKILLEIDPAAQMKLEKNNKLRQFSHDRFYHAGTQTVEDSFSWSNKMTNSNNNASSNASSGSSSSARRKGVISNSFLIKNLVNNNSNNPTQKKKSDDNLSDKEEDSDEKEEKEEMNMIAIPSTIHHSNSNSSRERERGGGSKVSQRLKSDTIFSDLLSKYYNKEQISQPFLGFVRKHEKIYAREIGLMKIALREYKRHFDSLNLDLQHLLALNGSNQSVVAVISHLQQAMENNNWMFDPMLFIRKANNNPLEDCIDVATQLRIIESYQELLANRLIMSHENQSLIRVQNQHLLEAANHLSAAANVKEDQHHQQQQQHHSPSSSTVIVGIPEDEEEGINHHNSNVTHSTTMTTTAQPQIQQHQQHSKRKSKLEMLTERRASLIHEYSLHSDNPNNSTRSDSQQQQQETLYHLINHTIKDLLLDITERMKRSGGWRAMLYRSDGSLDVNMSFEHFSLEEQVLIQTEKVQYLKMKLDQKQENNEKIINKLNKQNNELSNKIAALQQQKQQLQNQNNHNNHNNNHNKQQHHVVTVTNKEIATNTELSYLSEEMKEVTASDWNEVMERVNDINERMREASKQIEEERLLRHQLQVKVQQVQINSNHGNKRPVLTRDNTDNTNNTENSLSLSILSKKKALQFSDEPETEREERDDLYAASYVSDEELSRFSKDIINDYRETAFSSSSPPNSNNDNNTNTITTLKLDNSEKDKDKDKATQKPHTMTHNRSQTQRMTHTNTNATINANPNPQTRAQSAGPKRLNITNNNNNNSNNNSITKGSQSQSHQKEVEYLSFIGQKTLSSKPHQPNSVSVSTNRTRPWSSTTWRQIEKNSKDLFLPSTSTAPHKKEKEKANSADNGFDDEERVQHSEANSLLQQLATISESLEKAFFCSQPMSQQITTKERDKEKKSQRRIKPPSSPSPSPSEHQRSMKDSQNLDLQSEAFNGNLSHASRSWALNDQDNKDTETNTVNKLFSSPTPDSDLPVILPSIRRQLSEDIVIGVGESALEERERNNSFEGDYPMREATMITTNTLNTLNTANAAAANDTITANDSASQPPLVRSVTFRPPSFQLEESFLQSIGTAKQISSVDDGRPKDPRDREGVYSKLYQQMFSVLEAAEQKQFPMPQLKQATATRDQSPPLKFTRIIRSSDIPKSTISPEMAYYMSALQEKYREHKEESDKLLNVISSLERSYRGSESQLVKVLDQHHHPNNNNNSANPSTSSDKEKEKEKEALDYYKHSLRKEQLLSKHTLPSLTLSSKDS